MGLADEIGNMLGDAPIDPKEEILKEEIPKEEVTTEEETPVVIEDKTELNEEEEEEIPLTDREKNYIAQIEELRSAQLEKSPDPIIEKEKEEVIVKSDDPIDFIGDLDIDDVFGSKEEINKVLNVVYKRGVGDSRKLTAEKIMENLPAIITTYIGQHTSRQEMVNDFFRENSDLKDVRKTVAAVANDIASKNPGMELPELFKQSATKTRELLQMKKHVAKKEPIVKNPAFAKQNGRPAAKIELSGLEAEIEEMVDL